MAEAPTSALEITESATAIVTYEQPDAFTFSKPYILNDYNNTSMSLTVVSFDDAIAIVNILDKSKQTLVVRMAKGTLDKADESKSLVNSIVDRFMENGYRRVVVFENRGMGIHINHDSDAK